MEPLKHLEIKRRWFSWYLTKYLSREVLLSFFSGTTIFLSIMLLFQAIRLMEFMVLHQVGMTDVLKLCWFLGLSFLPVAVPIAFLFAVLMGISRANSEGEILALQANGISLRQIFAPLLVFGTLLSFVVLYLSLYTVPQGNRAFEVLYTRLSNERVISALKPGVFVDGFFGLMLLTEHIVPVKNELKKVFIYDRREETHPLAITASAGLLRNQPEKGILTLRLTDGAIHIENPQIEGIHQKIEFDVYDINLDLGESGGAWRAYSPPSYTLTQLNKRLGASVHNTPRYRELLVEYHRRFSMSFSCVVFVALGFGIGILSQRGIRSTAIILCLFVALGYWSAYLGVNAAAMAGWMPPWLGIWMPNVVLLAIAWGCYRRYVGG